VVVAVVILTDLTEHKRVERALQETSEAPLGDGERAGKATKRRPSVAIADDNEWIRAAVKDALEPFFEIAASVDDGRALIAAVSAHQPDAVVASLMMPGLTGIDVMRALRRLGSTAPFVIISADPNARARCLEAGAVGFVCKTQIASELARAVSLACRAPSRPGGGAIPAGEVGRECLPRRRV
jgi:CheY-like chemotaxis protein